MTQRKSARTDAPVVLASAGTKRIDELDGVRGLAIVLVLLEHYVKTPLLAERDPIAGFLVKLLNFCFAGVDLFFVLSGFLIGGILLRNRNVSNYLPAFYVRRLARLSPLYLLTIAGFALCAPYLSASGTEIGRWMAEGHGALPLWSYPLYVQNIMMVVRGVGGGIWLGPTWSLAIEEQFYLFAPLLILLLPDRSLPRVLVALIVSAPVLRTLNVMLSSDVMAAFVLLPCRWDALCIGILLAWSLQQPAVVTWLRTHQYELRHRLWLAVAALLGMSFYGIKVGSAPMLTLGHTFLALVAALLILCALYLESPGLKALFCNVWLRRLGLVSYGIYLLHMPVLGLAAQATTGHLPRLETLAGSLTMLAAVTVTLGLAAASWRWFEQPILRFSARATSRHAAIA